MAEFYSLENLALEEHGHYISNILVRLIQLSEDTSDKNFRSKYLDPTCKFLEDQIQDIVPSSIANELTEITLKVMVIVLRKYYILHSQDEETLDLITFLAVKLACAATPHCISSFQTHKITEDFGNIEIGEFQRLYVEEMLKKTQNIKELSLIRVRIFETIPPLEQLEQWRSTSTTDEILQRLCKSSKNLKALDLSGSYCGLSDRCVDLILQFQNLSCLNLIYTSISNEGIEKLIKAFKEHAGNYNNVDQQFTTSYLTYLGLILQSNYMQIINECLPHISTLNLVLLSSINLTPLKELKHLTSLTITTSGSYNRFSCIEGLIQEVGSHIYELKLGMDDIDFNMIERYCTVLNTFSLIFSKEYEFLEEQFLQHFPYKFESVENLNLSTSNSKFWSILLHIISSFVNIKRLNLNTVANPRCFEISMEECLLRYLRSGKLQKLTLNGIKIHIPVYGEKVLLTSNFGFSVIVATHELEDVLVETILKKWNTEFEKKVQNSFKLKETSKTS